MPIYCDEAGYTGVNLLEENQPIFVYSGLNIDADEGDMFAKNLKDKFRIQGELKGANQAKTTQGQQAIKELYERYADSVNIVFYHKKYALACKFYEYIFEPSLSSHNTAFYYTNFHRFIASLCYISFETSDEAAEDIFLLFQNLLRGNETQKLFNTLEREIIFDNQLIADVARFAVQQRQTVIDEITIDGEIAYWILDLARTALGDILRSWSEELDDELVVVCDTSKPLQEAVNSWDLFTKLHSEKIYGDILGRDVRINFSLKQPIEFRKSKGCGGLQLADLFASTAYYALVNPREPISQFIIEHLDVIKNKPGNCCIYPEPGLYLRPGSRDFDLGVYTLQKLVELSSKSSKNVGKRFADHMVRKIKAHNKKMHSGI